MKLPDESKTAARTYAKGIVDYHSRIKYAFSDDGSTWAVNVGLFADYPDAGVDSQSGCMAVTNEVMLRCYDPAVSRANLLIAEQLKSAASNHPGTVVKVRPRDLGCTQEYLFTAKTLRLTGNVA